MVGCCQKWLFIANCRAYAGDVIFYPLVCALQPLHDGWFMTSRVDQFSFVSVEECGGMKQFPSFVMKCQSIMQNLRAIWKLCMKCSWEHVLLGKHLSINSWQLLRPFIFLNSLAITRAQIVRRSTFHTVVTLFMTSAILMSSSLFFNKATETTYLRNA